MLDPRRPGVGDLAPGSAWYRSVAAAGAPPSLHYFSFSTDIVLNFFWQILWSTNPGPSYDFVGDGVMQAGNPAFNALPAWGGSEFLPFGQGSDQQQWVVQVNFSAPFTLNGWLAMAAGVLGEPYSHYNFGNKIGQLTVASCQAPFGTQTIPHEIVRIFSNPANACTLPGGAADRTAAAIRPLAPETERVARSMLFSNAPRSASAGASVARTGIVGFIDRSDRAELTLDTRLRSRGALELLLPKLGTFRGRIPGRAFRNRGTLILHLTIAAVNGGHPVRLGLLGVLRPASHYARLAVSISQRRVFTFLTPAPKLKDARALISRLAQTLRRNDLRTVVSLLAPELLAGSDTAAVARQLAGQHIRVASVRLIGSGQLQWLSNGCPTFTQSITAAARTPDGASTRFATLKLIDNLGHWRVLSVS